MIETYERPRKLTPKNIIYWNPECRELKNVENGSARITKAKRFIKENCIILDGNNFKCLPIQGYNKTTYSGSLTPSDCNCQFFNKTGKICSHILSAKMLKQIQDNDTTRSL